MDWSPELGEAPTSWFSLTTPGQATVRLQPDGFLLSGLESAQATADPFTGAVVGSVETAIEIV